MAFKHLAALAVVAGLLVFLKPTNAQYGINGITDARSIGLGNSYTNSSYGLMAIGKNPSLLANTGNDGREVSLMFPNITVASLNLQNASAFLSDIFGGRPSEIISGITSGKLRQVFDGDGQLSVVGALDFIALGYQPAGRVGVFAFSTTEYISTYLKLPQVVIDFSNDETFEGSASLNDFEFSTWWIRTYALSYARKFSTGAGDGIESIFAGATLKYYQGFAYTDIELNSTLNLSVGGRYLRGEYQAGISSAFSPNIREGTVFDTLKTQFRYPLLEPSGHGFGFDLGLTMVFERGVSVALALTDFGQINWIKNAHKQVVEGVVDIDKDFTPADIEGLVDSIHIIKEQSDSFGTPAPAAVRFGLGFALEKMIDRFPGHMMLVTDFNTPLNVSPGNSRNMRLSAGMEYHYRDKWPSLLTGITYGGISNGSWSLGFGYRTNLVHIYLSTYDFPALFNEDKAVSLSLTLNWVFSKN